MNLFLPNRRRFLTTTCGALAALTIAPRARVLGANARLGVGVIGLGGRGRALLDMALQRAEEKGDVEVRAVCDVYQRRLNHGTERADGAKAYLYHQEVLERPDIDVVMIATPDHWHAPITLAALERGLDVYVEKPMTHTVEEAQKVYHKALETKRIVQVGVQATSWSKWRKAKELVANGTLGQVVCCQGTYSRNVPGGDWDWEIEAGAGPDGKGENYIDWKQWLGNAPKRPFDPDRFFRFRKYWDYSGGIATDLHYHIVAPFHVAIRNDFPFRVAGMGGIWVHRDEREVPDTFLTAADYPGRYSMTVQSSQANTVGLRTLIRGEKATLYCGTDWEGEGGDTMRVVPEPPFLEELKVTWKQDELLITGAGDEGDMKHVDNFFDCVHSRQQPNCSAEFGYKVMTTIGLSVRSYREGKMFYFDAEHEKVKSRKIEQADYSSVG